MERGTKLTVKSSSLEFKVSGTNRILHFWDPVPFSETTDNWGKALDWIQKLEEIGGEPHLTVIEVTEVEETEALLRMTRLDAYWAELDVGKAEGKLEGLVKTGESLRQALAKHPQQQAEAREALGDARAKQQLLHGLLEEHGIMPS